MTDKMIRCGCGKIYNYSRLDNCPDCGASPGDSIDLNETNQEKVTERPAPAKDPGPNSSSKVTVSSSLPLKAGLLAGVVLILAIVAIKVFNPDSGVQAVDEPPVTTNDSINEQQIAEILETPMRTDSTVGQKEVGDNNDYLGHLSKYKKENTDTVTGIEKTSLSNSPSNLVDPGLVGSWRLDIPDIDNLKWFVRFDSNGKMSFQATGPAAPPPYTGKFEAQGGKWKIFETTNNWTDNGHYRIEADGDLFLQGRLGPAVWKKIK